MQLKISNGQKYILALVLISLLVRVALTMYVTGFSDNVHPWNVLGVFEGHDRLFGPENSVEGKFGYNYFPLWAVIVYIFSKLTALTGLSYVFWSRLLLFLADMAVSSVIFYWAKERIGEAKAFLLSLAYAVSPIAIWTSFYYIQFDALAVLFMLLAIMSFRKPWLSAAFLSIATMFKIFPALLLPIFLLRISNKKEIARFLLIFSLPLILILIPFIASRAEFLYFINRVFLYKPPFGAGWGFAKFFVIPLGIYKAGLFSFLSPAIGLLESAYHVFVRVSSVLLLAALAAAYYLTRKQDLKKASLVALLAIMMFSVYYYPHYLTWALPLLLVLALRYGLAYLALSSLIGLHAIIVTLSPVRQAAATSGLNFWTLSDIVLSMAIWLLGVFFVVKAVDWKNPGSARTHR